MLINDVMTKDLEISALRSRERLSELMYVTLTSESLFPPHVLPQGKSGSPNQNHAVPGTRAPLPTNNHEDKGTRTTYNGSKFA